MKMSTILVVVLFLMSLVSVDALMLRVSGRQTSVPERLLTSVPERLFSGRQIVDEDTFDRTHGWRVTFVPEERLTELKRVLKKTSTPTRATMMKLMEKGSNLDGLLDQTFTFKTYLSTVNKELAHVTDVEELETKNLAVFQERKGFKKMVKWTGLVSKKVYVEGRIDSTKPFYYDTDSSQLVFTWKIVVRENATENAAFLARVAEEERMYPEESDAPAPVSAPAVAPLPVSAPAAAPVGLNRDGIMTIDISGHGDEGLSELQMAVARRRSTIDSQIEVATTSR